MAAVDAEGNVIKFGNEALEALHLDYDGALHAVWPFRDLAHVESKILSQCIEIAFKRIPTYRSLYIPNYIFYDSDLHLHSEIVRVVSIAQDLGYQALGDFAQEGYLEERFGDTLQREEAFWHRMQMVY